MNLDKIKDRIRKMLALANDGAASEGEVENAMAFAQKLMDEHHLDQADVAPEEVKYDSNRVYCQSNLTPWENSLAWAIVKTIGSVGWYTSGRRRVFDTERKAYATKTVLTFYGPSDDVALATEMWDTMRITIMALGYAKYGAVYRGRGRSYCIGFAEVLHEMANTHVNDVRTSECTAIILKKTALAMQWLAQEKGVKLSKGRRSNSRVNRDDAYENGREDGANNPLSGVRRKVTNESRLLA